MFTVGFFLEYLLDEKQEIYLYLSDNTAYEVKFKGAACDVPEYFKGCKISTIEVYKSAIVINLAD